MSAAVPAAAGPSARPSVAFWPSVPRTGGYPDGRTRRRGQEPAERPQVRGISVRFSTGRIGRPSVNDLRGRGPWKQQSCRCPAGSGPGERRAGGRSQPRYGHDLSYSRYAVVLGLSPRSPRAHPRGGHAEPRPGRHTSRRAPGYPALKPPPWEDPDSAVTRGKINCLGPWAHSPLPNAPAGPAHSRRADGRAPPNLAKEFA
jgi:hypothetical protein